MAEQLSPDKASAVKKRSIARRFNDTLTPLKEQATVIDQRTARRLDRYKEELRAGRTAGGQPLKAIEVAMRVNELLAHGERLTDIKRLAKTSHFGEYNEEEMIELLREMHTVYNFRPDAYRFVGITNATLKAAGVIDVIPAKRGRKPKKAQG